MRIKTILIFVTVAFLIFISTEKILSQEATVESGAVPREMNESETLWLWGEVVNLDLQNKMLLVKYLDYETDQEKEISISVDEKTTYENIKSIDELRPNDSVSVDYVISTDGKNIARNISVEKAENTKDIEEGVLIEEPVPATVEETTPEKAP